MWTANLDSVAKDGQNVVVMVTFTSGITGETYQEQIPGNNLTPDNLATYVRNVIQDLTVRDLTIQILTPTIGPITIPAPTPDQQAALTALEALIAS
jgi:hypothetical protein